MNKPLRVALIHYWLIEMRGGEKVLEALCEMFPDADIYTHAVDPTKLSFTIKRHKIITTFIGRLPMSTRLYQGFLPLMPRALEGLDLSDYDLVISSESGPAKGVITRPDAIHLCYCHSPMRYIWDQYHVYRRNSGLATRLFMSFFAKGLRIWDQSSASRVDKFIANSNYVKMRISKYYGRDADVIFPPVDLDGFQPAAAPTRDFYLCLGQLVTYKKTDVAVQAFNTLGKRLVIVGDGGDRKKLEKMAGPNVEFLGRASDEQIASLYANCEALIFPGQEDFGIVPLEAMASGRPVIAYRGGGALDTVVENVTGMFFDEQTPQSLIDAIARYEAKAATFQPSEARLQASLFGQKRFKAEIQCVIDTLVDAGSRPTRVPSAAVS